MTTPAINLGWVKPPVIDRLKGFSYECLRNYIRDKGLIEEYHFRKGPHGALVIHYERFDSWLGGEPDG